MKALAYAARFSFALLILGSVGCSGEVERGGLVDAGPGGNRGVPADASKIPDSPAAHGEADAGPGVSHDALPKDSLGGSDAAAVPIKDGTPDAVAGPPAGCGSGTTITDSDFSGDWIARLGKGEFVPGFAGGSYTEKITVGNDTCLRVHFKGGTPGSGNGMFFKSPVSKGNHYSLEFTFRLKPGFVYNHTGKLFGFKGGVTTAGVKPTGSDGFTARSTWNGQGKAVAYVYHPEQYMWGGYGDTFPFGPIPSGQMHAIREDLILNTPGKHDGQLRLWLDGVLGFEQTSFRFRDVSSLQIDKVTLETFFGGNEPRQGPLRDEYIDFCRVRVCRH